MRSLAVATRALRPRPRAHMAAAKWTLRDTAPSIRLQQQQQQQLRAQSSVSMAAEVAVSSESSSATLSVADDFGMGSGGTPSYASDPYYLPASRRKAATRERYRLGSELGRGHYARVFEALDVKTGKKVAVKMMDKRTAPREICENELRILEELRDSGERRRVTPIMDVFEDKTHLFLVLELMRGGDFFDRVSKRGRIDETEAAVVTRKLCFALAALHELGILHRDVKLENLLLDGATEEEEDEEADDVEAARAAGGVAAAAGGGGASKTSSGSSSMGSRNHRELPGSFKLGDLGFARKDDGGSDAFTNPAGTLGYVAPEVLRDRMYSPACDVWSAGVVLYTMLAGHAPFPRDPRAPEAATMDEKVAQELEAIEFGRERQRWERRLGQGVWEDVSTDAKSLVSRMLILDPHKRITTAQVLRDPWILQNSALRFTEYNNFE